MEGQSKKRFSLPSNPNASSPCTSSQRWRYSSLTLTLSPSFTFSFSFPFSSSSHSLIHLFLYSSCRCDLPFASKAPSYPVSCYRATKRLSLVVQSSFLVIADIMEPPSSLVILWTRRPATKTKASSCTPTSSALSFLLFLFLLLLLLLRLFPCPPHDISFPFPSPMPLFFSPSSPQLMQLMPNA